MNTAATAPRVRRDPFATPFGSLFDAFFGEFMSPERWTPLLGRLPGELAAVMRPRMNVIDKGSADEAAVDLRGVRKDDIDVSIEGGWVTIDAEAKGSQASKNGERLLHGERWACACSRSVELPSEVAEAGAEARFENGVLRLTPKGEPAAVERLTVR